MLQIICCCHVTSWAEGREFPALKTMVRVGNAQSRNDCVKTEQVLLQIIYYYNLRIFNTVYFCIQFYSIINGYL